MDLGTDQVITISAGLSEVGFGVRKLLRLVKTNKKALNAIV